MAIKTDTISAIDGTSPVSLTAQSAAKVWAHVDGVTTTTIVNSFNLTSVTDGGVGTTTYTLTNSMESADWAGASAGRSYHVDMQVHMVGSYLVYNWYGSGSGGGRVLLDQDKSQTTVHGDLA